MANKLSFPQPMKVPYEIWLRLAQGVGGGGGGGAGGVEEKTFEESWTTNGRRSLSIL